MEQYNSDSAQGAQPLSANSTDDLAEMPVSSETDARVLRSAGLESAVLVYNFIATVGRYRSVADRKTSKGDLINAQMNNKKAAKVTKDLFPRPKFSLNPGEEPSEEQNAQIIAYRRLKAIDSLDTKTRTYITLKSLPSPLRSTVRIVPVRLLEAFDLQMRGFAMERQNLLADFLEVYPLVRAIAQDSLGELFAEGDYPTTANIASHFSFEWKYIQMGLPDAIAEIDQSIFEREREKAAAQWADTQRDIEQLLAVRMRKLLDNLTERMRPNKDGTPKVFRDSLLGNVEEFMRDFNALNITNNRELAGIADQVRALMSGVNPIALRGSRDLREHVIAATGTIDDALKTMIADAPTRAFKF